MASLILDALLGSFIVTHTLVTVDHTDVFNL